METSSNGCSAVLMEDVHPFPLLKNKPDWKSNFTLFILKCFFLPLSEDHSNYIVTDYIH